MNRMRARRASARLWAWWCLLSFACLADEPPPVMLANVYEPGVGVDVTAYWISEKLDGVRGYWDGEKLSTRSGNAITAPAWFTAGWPSEPLDGELWAGRGRFELVSSAVRTRVPDDDAWRQVRFMVFDLPKHAGAFSERLDVLNDLLDELAVPWVQAVPQFRVADSAALDAALAEVVAEGGEGLILHRAASRYRAGSSGDLLKYKLHQEGEARVVGHVPGRGKYEGLLGALLVERPDGLRFRLGTGFTDDERRRPPPVGSSVAYAYNGLTRYGVPRFARFLRTVESRLPSP